MSTTSFKLNARSIYYSLVVITFICMAAAAVAIINFSGEWALNEQKSNLGEGNMGRMVAKKLKITQENATITISRTGTSRDGQETTWEEKLSFDGKEVESTAYGDAKRKSSSKWSDDGKSMTINATTLLERDGNQIEIKAVEIWKLSEDGKTITVDATSTSPRGTTTRSLVYDKK